MGTSGDDSSSSSEESSSVQEPTIHFLPTLTNRSNTRRDVELLRSSARSHLAKAMHRQNKFKTGKGKGKGKGGANKTRDQGNSGEGIAVDPLELVRYQQVSDKLVDDHTQMLLHYSRNCFWPGFGMGAATFHVPPFALNYSNLVEQGPALYHAILWSSAVSLNFNRSSKVTDVGSIKHYQEALGHVSRDIKKPVSEIGEKTMYAIMSLVGPEFTVKKKKKKTPTAFDPPLSTLAWLNAFGRQPLTELHVAALFRLVDLKGGLDSISASGFRADLNCMDLIRSTQKLRRPHFPVSDVYQEVYPSHSRKLFFGHSADFQAVTSDDSLIDSLTQLGLPDEILEVMLDMRVWVYVLEGYHNRVLSNPDLSLIGSHRDLIQHRLLSTLPEHEKFGSGEAIENYGADSQINIGDLVQAGLLIFSLGVTFPITYERPFELASQRLRYHLQREAHLLMRLGMYDVLLWLGMLVALCAEQVGDDDLGAWCSAFLYHVESVRRKGSLSEDDNPAPRTWQEVRDDSLVPFLWSSVACDRVGESIWEQVQELLRTPVERNTTFM
ncbi:hypothetical protein ACHAPT_012120 [Fusarium lateritium]